MPDVMITPQDAGYPVSGVNAVLLGEQLSAINVEVSTGSAGVRLHLADAGDEAAARAIVAAHDAAQQSAGQQLLSSIKATAQSAEGVALNDLTQAQIKALVAVLLWRVGAVANDATVRALNEWAG